MPEDASDDELLTAHDAASFERFYMRRVSAVLGYFPDSSSALRTDRAARVTLAAHVGGRLATRKTAAGDRGRGVIAVRRPAAGVVSITLTSRGRHGAVASDRSHLVLGGRLTAKVARNAVQNDFDGRAGAHVRYGGPHTCQRIASRAPYAPATWCW